MTLTTSSQRIVYAFPSREGAAWSVVWGLSAPPGLHLRCMATSRSKLAHFKFGGRWKIQKSSQATQFD